MIRPRWLRGWRWWAGAQPQDTVAGDRRPLRDRLLVLIGLRREW